MFSSEHEGLLKVDGFDDCIVGIARRFGLDPVIAYSYEKIIQKLIDRDNMDYQESVEFFEFNIIGSWVGDRTPIFIEEVI